MASLSRRDFLKLGGLSLGSLAFTPSMGNLFNFDDSNLVRVATNSVSVYSKPTDQSLIVSTWFRDELVHVYGEVVVDEPKHNPVWYRVWGGFMHRARLQRVKTLFNETIPPFEEGSRRLVEVTVPYTQAYRYSKTFNWRPNLRLYFGSVHWIENVEAGPFGEPWYRVYDDLTGFPYHVDPLHVRPIPLDEQTPINPDIPFENKRIEVNLTTQVLIAFEYDKQVFKTTIASGLATPRKPKELSTKTPIGDFNIQEKMPAKHMGDGNLFADTDDYELPGVPWTCFFTSAGHAFHGTYWHENFGTPMSHGCVNMRTEDAKWLFRWALPPHQPGRTFNRGYGTPVRIYY
jgi:lipoprotein-anchoring transpeptidase ErfK/SrfK